MLSPKAKRGKEESTQEMYMWAIIALLTMYLSVDVRHFQAILHFLPKLSHIHVQIHCNANEESQL